MFNVKGNVYSHMFWKRYKCFTNISWHITLEHGLTSKYSFYGVPGSAPVPSFCLAHNRRIDWFFFDIRPGVPWTFPWRNSHAYGTYWPSFQSPFLESIGVILYSKGYQMIELFILMQLIQVLTPGSNLINFYEDQKEVGCVRLFHINKVWFVILS